MNGLFDKFQFVERFIFGWVKLPKFQIIRGGSANVQLTSHMLRQRYRVSFWTLGIFLFLAERYGFSPFAAQHTRCAAAQIILDFAVSVGGGALDVPMAFPSCHLPRWGRLGKKGGSKPPPYAAYARQPAADLSTKRLSLWESSRDSG